MPVIRGFNDMLFAGLLSMLAIGASAFVGFDFGDKSDEDEAANTEDQGGSDPQASGEGQPDIIDLIYNDLPDIPENETGIIAQGDEADNTVIGTTGDDRLNGYAGDDLIVGGAGDDELIGDFGRDILLGGEGDDILHGGDDDDMLFGDAGDDQLYGHGDNDTMSGGDGDDLLVGSEGDDRLMGDAGDDRLHGDLGDDRLNGGQGFDTLFGGWGNDIIIGVTDDPETEEFDDIDGKDYLNGGGGDDILIAGQGDVITTGTGADTTVLGDWLTQEHQAKILDFSATEDNLVVVYDDSTDADPDISIEQDEDDESWQHVVLNGVRIAAVVNAEGLNLAHITLISQSSVESLLTG